MSIESPKNPGQSYGAMMNLWEQIQQLGRNDAENAAGLEIIRLVEEREITPEEGERRMYALLESKQLH